MEQNFILPQQCTKCGSYFDLYFELSESSHNPEAIEIREKLGKKLSQSLCWECRQQALEDFDQKQETDDTIDDFIIDLEFE